MTIKFSMPKENTDQLARLNAVIGKKKKASKYHNEKTLYDGIRFDSKKEAGRWQELRLWELTGTIQMLRRQVPYTITVNGFKICRFIADFAYVPRSGQPEIVEDVKSKMTRRLPVYRLKKKLMKAVHGIDIVEI